MIQTRDLACRFADGKTLRFADVDVPQGGTLLLRGPSGSGKSTWLALAAGLLSTAGGEMVVAGQSVGALAPAARDAWRARTIGFLPQRLLLSEALTVSGNLGLVFFAGGLPQDKVAIHHTLDALGVAHLAARKPANLSGGESQRVALARALLLRPRVILADEPTASLDDAACAAALTLLRERVQAAGATLVIATHDARVVQALPGAQLLAMGANA
ncbi:MAG: ABC transporter [Betaproteobacteria bacterium HGW-Betaproteobacteria-9]|nr:ATP-binding cassette domain-containing protein [Hydrogenophaga sp.]PKO30028.1 MAG: ABC transporter [Betaproteobacteria bacterium HGW-Betaproteobacteria-9]